MTERDRVKSFQQALERYGGVVVDGKLICRYSLEPILHTSHCLHKQVVLLQKESEHAYDATSESAGLFYGFVALKPSERASRVLAREYEKLEGLFDDLM